MSDTDMDCSLGDAGKNGCTCSPCTTPEAAPWGGYGPQHCVACCAGSLIETYDARCPMHEHRAMAQRQFSRPSSPENVETPK